MTFSCTADPVDGILTPPIITWVDPRGDLVPEGGNNNPKVESQTRNLVFSDVTANNGGVYMCRAVINIPLALIDNHFDESSMAINTSCKSPIPGSDQNDCLSMHFSSVVPGQVKNLTCADRSTPDMLHLSWKRPTFLGSEVVDYKVEVRELQHRSGAQKVTEVPIRNLATTMETYNISQGLSECYGCTLDGLTPVG